LSPAMPSWPFFIPHPQHIAGGKRTRFDPKRSHFLYHLCFSASSQKLCMHQQRTNNCCTVEHTTSGAAVTLPVHNPSDRTVHFWNRTLSGGKLSGVVPATE